MQYSKSVLLFIILTIILCGCCHISFGPSAKSVVKSTDQETVAFVFSLEGDWHIYCGAVWIGENELLTANHCVDFANLLINGERDSDGMLDMDQPLPDSNGLKMSFLGSKELDSYGNPTSLHFAKVVYVDPDHDLALLKTKGQEDNHPYAKLASTSPEVGDHLYIVGHPGELSWTHEEGTVSAYRMSLPNQDFEGPFMQVQAPIFGGNSGGGAFNDSGELVGICSFIPRKVPDVGFYIPLSSIYKFLNDSK